MVNQPIIIEVLSREAHLAIQKRVLFLASLGAAFLLITLLMIRDLLGSEEGLVIMGAILILLLSNTILFFRNRMIDQHVRSLCIEDGRCFLSSRDFGTCASPPSKLHYKQESLALPRKTNNQAESERAYQVLAHRDWKMVKHLSLPTSSN